MPFWPKPSLWLQQIDLLENNINCVDLTTNLLYHYHSSDTRQQSSSQICWLMDDLQLERDVCEQREVEQSWPGKWPHWGLHWRYYQVVSITLAMMMTIDDEEGWGFYPRGTEFLTFWIRICSLSVFAQVWVRCCGQGQENDTKMRCFEVSELNIKQEWSTYFLSKFIDNVIDCAKG